MPFNLLPDEKLVSLLREGDERAFNELFKRYWTRMYAAAFKRLKSKERCEELVQDLFASLWGKRRELQIHTNLQNYLYTSVKYMTIRACQRKELERNAIARIGAGTPEMDSSTDVYLGMRDFQQQLRKEISHLPAKCRTVFELSRYKHYSTKEIAATLEVSEKAVEYHMSRALRILRAQLKEFFPVMLLYFFL